MFIKVKHMTSINQNSSIHWFNMNAVLNRVNDNSLKNNKPIMSILDVEKKKIPAGGTRTFCSAMNCTNSKLKNPELSFFRFPCDEKRYEN